MAELDAVALGVEPVTEGDAGDAGVGVHQRAGLAVEAQDVGQHAQKARVEQVGALGEHGVETGAGPFQAGRAGARQLDRKRHLARRRLDSEFIEQPDQVRVGALVKHQEAGIDAERGAVERDVDCIAVTAEITARFEQRHVLPRLRQAVRA